MVVALQRPGAAGTGTNRDAIGDVRIFGMYGDKAAFPGAGIGAVAERDGTPGGGARRRDRGVVLLCGINAIGILVVGIDAIELRRGLVVDRRPGLAAVAAHAGAAVVAFDHTVRIGGGRPKGRGVPAGRLGFRAAGAARARC